MKQAVMQLELPVFSLQLKASECRFDSAHEIAEYLKEKVESHKAAIYIATFDHYAHTKAVDGEIAPAIKDAKNLVFCFGIKLPNPHVLAVRPRSIGVADMGDHFHLSFLEPPMELATKEMEAWCKGLADKA